MYSFFNETPEHIHELFKQVPSPKKLAYNVEVPNSKTKGFSSVYRNSYDPQNLITDLHPSIESLYDTFEISCQINGKKPCLGKREKLADGSFGGYTFDDYNTVRQRRNNLGSGVFYILTNNPYKTDSEAHSKIKYDPTTKESFILTIFSHNRPEWALCDLTSAAYSITNTALYDTLGPDASKYILGLTESPIIICSKEKIETLINLKKNSEELSNLISLVSMDPLDDDYILRKLAHEAKITLYDLGEVEKLGEINALPPIPPKKDSLFTISFTSGTTGNPKGVMLTQQNLIASLISHLSGLGYQENGTHYSFLPLAHIYERCVIQWAMMCGMKVGFPQGPSPLTLIEDIQILQPTCLSLVPRVLTKLEAAIKSQTIHSDKPWLAALFNRAINEKIRLQKQNDFENPSHLIYDRLFNALKKKLGMSKVVYMTTGSAPLSPSTFEFLQAVLNIPNGIYSGYGMTETVSGMAVGPPNATKLSVGPVATTVEVKLRDIPDMNYSSSDEVGPRGEILLRGAQIFGGYYKNDEETKKSFDEDGWFYTGDVAHINPDDGNRLYIIDRVKNFYKLAQGEYVSPEKIEGLYLSQFPYVQQLYVHGDSLQTFLVGIVGLDVTTIPQYIMRRFKDKINDKDDIVKFFSDTKNKKIFLNDMNKAIANQLQGFEKLHNIDIKFDPLTVEDNVITPTMKIKRPVASKFFKESLDKMYEEGSLIKNGNLKDHIADVKLDGKGVEKIDLVDKIAPVCNNVKIDSSLREAKDTKEVVKAKKEFEDHEYPLGDEIKIDPISKSTKPLYKVRTVEQHLLKDNSNEQENREAKDRDIIVDVGKKFETLIIIHLANDEEFDDLEKKVEIKNYDDIQVKTESGAQINDDDTNVDPKHVED
ncbi:unnamed protein product [Candida verbasci]|uniref:AMP-dependent synthetase/ligase domain-containing protein n=1 Tax=Candida verbasci TaxID=1227364 RepID=A0A9W4TXY5_9ASCO|nr:unnamed protein product [Candida verbasci]